MSNIDRAAALRAVLDLHPKSSGQRWVGFPRADRQEHYCMADQQAWPCDTIRALAEVGWLAPTPQIIRNREELEALDPDTVLTAFRDDGVDVIFRAWDAWQNDDTAHFPAVVICGGAEVRTAREALEEE